ncbi:DUF3892 domain-containing protein [Microbacterium sp. STN6]|uniref:DUF3892 domain-containing protein n=1 Tax=Microbacterium sp. STN6 TaxID=2995588 RepID=UPI0022609198|nr:DUF3892 domain-containing protein [Microbacterium sp. STN6]MCX7521580.1 DUF3892 domain-containing protein [Microbacterium sp. STN6]
MFEITGIAVSRKPPTLDTITSYYFQGRDGEISKWMSKPAAVTYVRQNALSVYASGGGSRAYVEVVQNGSAPYLRTKGDGTTSDNLLSQKIYN